MDCWTLEIVRLIFIPLKHDNHSYLMSPSQPEEEKYYHT